MFATYFSDSIGLYFTAILPCMPTILAYISIVMSNHTCVTYPIYFLYLDVVFFKMLFGNADYVALLYALFCFCHVS
jgi:hypothetical protein